MDPSILTTEVVRSCPLLHLLSVLLVVAFASCSSRIAALRSACLRVVLPVCAIILSPVIVLICISDMAGRRVLFVLVFIISRARV